jgi:hypothetical protein
MKKIPVEVAEKIAKDYGYEQVIVLAISQHKEKSNWFDGWVTTFNKHKSKCKFLGEVGALLHNNFRSFYGNEEMTESYYRKMMENQSK